MKLFYLKRAWRNRVKPIVKGLKHLFQTLDCWWIIIRKPYNWCEKDTFEMMLNFEQKPDGSEFYKHDNTYYDPIPF